MADVSSLKNSELAINHGIAASSRESASQTRAAGFLYVDRSDPAEGSLAQDESVQDVGLCQV
jgi:hypothetical protein